MPQVLLYYIKFDEKNCLSYIKSSKLCSRNSFTPVRTQAPTKLRGKKNSFTVQRRLTGVTLVITADKWLQLCRSPAKTSNSISACMTKKLLMSFKLEVFQNTTLGLFQVPHFRYSFPLFLQCSSVPTLLRSQAPLVRVISPLLCLPVSIPGPQSYHQNEDSGSESPLMSPCHIKSAVV